MLSNHGRGWKTKQPWPPDISKGLIMGKLCDPVTWLENLVRVISSAFTSSVTMATKLSCGCWNPFGIIYRITIKCFCLTKQPKEVLLIVVPICYFAFGLPLKYSQSSLCKHWVFKRFRFVNRSRWNHDLVLRVFSFCHHDAKCSKSFFYFQVDVVNGLQITFVELFRVALIFIPLGRIKCLSFSLDYQ